MCCERFRVPSNTGAPSTSHLSEANVRGCGPLPTNNSQTPDILRCKASFALKESILPFFSFHTWKSKQECRSFTLSLSLSFHLCVVVYSLPFALEPSRWQTSAKRMGKKPKPKRKVSSKGNASKFEGDMVVAIKTEMYDMLVRHNRQMP